MAKRLTIEQMNEIAGSRGGQCLSEHYTNAHEKLLWECGNEHVWKASSNRIRNGTWCPRCARKQNGEAKRLTLEEMQDIALQRNGRCLSKQYVSATTKMSWRCCEGHLWDATPNMVKRGTWCPVCASKKRGASQRLSIEEMRTLAVKMGGKCLSGIYHNARTKLLWECSFGHQWKATADSIKSGRWCPVCALKRRSASLRLSIKDMKTLADEHGGSCLSTVYVNARSKLIWQCAKGHQWEATAGTVTSGHWCPTCGGTEKLSIEEIRQIAESRGGKCLSQRYINVHTKLLWCCAEGHRWEATPEKIKMGRWCPGCSTGLGERICRAFFEQLFEDKFPKSYPPWLGNERGNQMELDGFCEALSLAFEHHGEQHFSTKTHFITSYDRLRQRQDDDSLKRSLCIRHGVALIEIPEVPSRLPVEELRNYIRLECQKKKIRVPTDFDSIKVNLKVAYATSGSRQVMNELQTLARERNGKCLSESYVSDSTKMHWQCAKGHQWMATPNNIKHGKWCPKCGGSERLTIEDMRKCAEERCGICLSDTYTNNRTKLRWQCAKGHQWEATADNIRSGHWCPTCGLERRSVGRRLDIQEMRDIAQERGGRCLSVNYKNARSKLIWVCAKNHQWEATPDKVKRGTWCPYCS